MGNRCYYGFFNDGLCRHLLPEYEIDWQLEQDHWDYDGFTLQTLNLMISISSYI